MYQLLKMDVQQFDSIQEVAARACRMAYRNDQPVRFRFNGIALNVGTLDEPQDIVQRYHREVELAEG